jgi:hypothetical protein
LHSSLSANTSIQSTVRWCTVHHAKLNFVPVQHPFARADLIQSLGLKSYFKDGLGNDRLLFFLQECRVALGWCPDFSLPLHTPTGKSLLDVVASAGRVALVVARANWTVINSSCISHKSFLTNRIIYIKLYLLRGDDPGFPYLVACSKNLQGTRRANSETGVRGHLDECAKSFCQLHPVSGVGQMRCRGSIHFVFPAKAKFVIPHPGSTSKARSSGYGLLWTISTYTQTRNSM